MHDEFESEGLVVLALSDEAPETVDKYLKREGLTVRTAAGSRSKAAWGVNGIPASFLVGPDGNVLWKGSPARLTRELLRDLLGDLEKPAEGDFLALQPAAGARMHTSLTEAVRAAEAGRLGAALAAARPVAASSEEAQGSAGARAAASALVRDIEAHVALLRAQAEEYDAAREVLLARALLRGLGGALADSEDGAWARTRLEELAEDAEWTAELEGALAFEAALAATIGEDRATGRRALRVVVEEHPGTLAAQRAKRRVKHR